jgi:hypothetical protein
MTVTLDRVERPRPALAVATPSAAVLGVVDLPANVQHYDDVALLPWAEAFAMTYTVEPVERPKQLRRRYDMRSLADVVWDVAA